MRRSRSSPSVPPLTYVTNPRDCSFRSFISPYVDRTHCILLGLQWVNAAFGARRHAAASVLLGCMGLLVGLACNTVAANFRGHPIGFGPLSGASVYCAVLIAVGMGAVLLEIIALTERWSALLAPLDCDLASGAKRRYTALRRDLRVSLLLSKCDWKAVAGLAFSALLPVLPTVVDLLANKLSGGAWSPFRSP